MTNGKTIALTRRTFVAKVMSLLFNMLSRLVINFLPRSKHLLILWLQSPSAVILEPSKIKSDTVSTVSPSISHGVMGLDAMIFVFWMLSFKPTFSLSSFTFTKRLFSSSSLSAIRAKNKLPLYIQYFGNKGPSSQGYGFSSSHVWMWELDYKESWVPKNWCFWTVMLEKTLESPLDCKEIQPLHPKGNQSWLFIGRTDVEAKNSNPLDTWCKELTHWKRPWCWERRREEKETTEDEMVGWHHRLNGHEFE